MFIHELFTVVTNLFGLNFFEQKVSLTFVLFFQLAANFFTAVVIYFAFIIGNPKFKAIFVVLDFVQLCVPLLMRLTTTIRAVTLRNSDKKFDERTRKVYSQSVIARNQAKFFIIWGIAAFMFLFKTALGTILRDHVYNFSHFMTTILNSAGDMVFVYHMMCLRDHIKSIDTRKGDIREKVLQILEIQRLIELRYTSHLGFAVSAYFIYIIIALYWLFIRLVFGFLQTINGEVQIDFSDALTFIY